MTLNGKQSGYPQAQVKPSGSDLKSSQLWGLSFPYNIPELCCHIFKPRLFGHDSKQITLSSLQEGIWIVFIFPESKRLEPCLSQNKLTPCYHGNELLCSKCRAFWGFVLIKNVIGANESILEYIYKHKVMFF